jgi:hypothetical protein
MNFDDFRQRAAAARAVPLESVLTFRGAQRDRQDKSKWHTERGPLSVTGPKFINWCQGQGGGGAIDLVMHLAGVDCVGAIQWLERHFAAGTPVLGEPVPNACGRAAPPSRPGPSPPRLPMPDARMLDRVCRYLTRCRCLSPSFLEPLIESGMLYADCRANAVILLVAGKPNRPVGAELRGTGPRVWRGMASGSRKDLGYFWTGVPGSREIVLCESAIDAISCLQMDPQRLCISTSGVRADPPWLGPLIARGYALHCGFDADEPGDAAAARMIALHPCVRRLRPPAHDWNDALRARR